MLNIVKLCMITDESYVIPTIVAITSAIKNKNADTNYEIFIITKNITDVSREKLLELVQDKVKIKLIDASALQLMNVKIHSHVPQTALLKFELANILKNENKILYLDGDIIVQKDLSELYNIDLGLNCAAVVGDLAGEEIRKLHIKCGVDKYFNSGVMLLNLDVIRKTNSVEKLVQAKINHPEWTCMDQDAFNFVFQNRVLWLEPKYNATTAAFVSHKFDIQTINKYYRTTYFSFTDLENDSIIIHFAGCSKTRPWQYLDVMYSMQWEHYYLQSPLKNIALNRKIYDNLLYPKIKPFLHAVFSITNHGCYKVLCILGMKIKFKKF